MSRKVDRCSSWFRELQSSHPVSIQKAIRVLAALCALGLLGGVTISVWFIVKLLLKPTSNSPTGLEDTKETSFCNISDDSSVTDPRKVFYRISAENSLLEIQLEKLQTWLPVCYERWNSSLGTLVCRQLGHLRLWHQGKDTQDNWWCRCHTRQMAMASESLLQQSSHLWRIHHNKPVDHYSCSLLHQVSSWVVYAGIVTRNAAKLAQYMGYTVEKIIYNKNYNHRSHDSDIALMKLRNPLNFSDTIRPVCLPQYDHELPGGTLCWISGWGHTQPDNVHIPDTLKEAQVPLISTKKCNSSCMYNGEITPRMLCAGHTEGNVDACQGDSGGPLVCQDNNVWRLVGVVSWGTGCAEPNHPGVYTKVAEFLGWIFEIIETY
ncbi:transmembrane protease serine 5 isoform X6 [Pangasianodon hypophthalmus]|uniref:transmembrane protease serine 5 isoform X6 n=1 Tax=Pangasianodon hypophthalmus TaxID=310915 RepID=UPI0023076AEB|nr:transmembrane protease serine 5 isoform X6 [Pangasianodon hypophthalmus]